MVDPVKENSAKLLNIIFIEDSEDDYDLIKRRIQREGYMVNAARVETAGEYEAAIANEVWDVVISDNSLPSFDAAAALKMTRSKLPFIPFIIVSGTIGEVAAVAAMRAGANDYIIKNDLARLVPAIERELEDIKIIKAKHISDNALEESQERYRLLAENIQDLVCLHNPDSSYLWLSPSVEKILGYKAEELIGQSIIDFIHPDDIKSDPNDIFKETIPGSHIRLSYRIRRKDGIFIHVEAMIQPIYEAGRLMRAVSTTRDISDQQRAHNLLAESEARYQAVIESMAEGLIIYDDSGNFTSFNESAAKILGIQATTKEEYEKAFKALRFFNPDLQIVSHAALPSRVTLKTGKSQLKVILGVKRQEERMIWLSASADPFLQPDKKMGVVLSFSDITEQKLYEDSLNAVAKELTTLIDTANAPIFGIDWHGKINEWNQVAAKLTGYGKEEVIGKSLIDEFILDNYKVSVAELLRTALRGHDVTSYELPIHTRSGKVVTILFNATARKNTKSEIVGVIGVGQDITELIEYREGLEMKVAERTRELHEALQKEKELVALKSKFVSMASHEFRTPLSTITFATGFIKKYYAKLKPEEVVLKLDKVAEQVEHMTYLLDDVLLIGKNESGKIRLHPVAINLSDFCKKIIDEVGYTTENTHKILFSITTEKKQLYIDEKLLRNILINLMSNAIKFSPEKDKILLDVKYSLDYLTLVVKDWGMGIEQEELEKVFEAFHRSNNVGSIQGTGLGLSIVKKAVELQRGIIKVDSIVDEGTTIKVQIPLINEENISR
ncbi:MAG: PAS domain S-box protein [Fulvivirga sp.]